MVPAFKPLRSVSINIDLSALRSNLSQIKKISGDCKVFAVLKANAYGHNATVCAKALDEADGFAVVVPSEAIALREEGVDKPILVIQGPRTESDIFQAVDNNLTLAIHCEEQLHLIEQVSHKLENELNVWIKLDTGMARLGFVAEQLSDIVTFLEVQSNVNIQGCMTHFSCADEPDNFTTKNQLNRFANVTRDFEGSVSLANSAAIIAWPGARQGWLRPGIMLYGVNPFWPEAKADLAPVMTVRAPLIAVRNLTSGQTIGYGNTYCCKRDMRVAVVAVGYGDGYPRHINSEAYVLLNGKRCRVLGRVSMDSIVINLESVPEARHGDQVTLWGNGLPVEQVAEFANTLSYELLCQIQGEFLYP